MFPVQMHEIHPISCLKHHLSLVQVSSPLHPSEFSGNHSIISMRKNPILEVCFSSHVPPMALDVTASRRSSRASEPMTKEAMYVSSTAVDLRRQQVAGGAPGCFKVDRPQIVYIYIYT